MIISTTFKKHQKAIKDCTTKPERSEYVLSTGGPGTKEFLDTKTEKNKYMPMVGKFMIGTFKKGDSLLIFDTKEEAMQAAEKAFEILTEDLLD